MSDELGKYIDKQVVKKLYGEVTMRQFIQDQSAAPPLDSTGIISTDGTKVTVPGGQEFNAIRVGSPGAVDATVRLNSSTAAMVQEGVDFIYIEPASERWFILPLFDEDATEPVVPPPWINDLAWWMKPTDSDKAYRLPFEVLPTQTDPEFMALNLAGAIMYDAILDTSGQHLVMFKSQKKFINDYTTDYFGETWTYPGPPGGTLPPNPVARDTALEVQYVVFKNFTLNDSTLEVESGDQVQGSFTLDGTGYTPRPNTIVNDSTVVDFRLIPVAVVRSMQWMAEVEGDDIKLKSVTELLMSDFYEVQRDNGMGSTGYGPSSLVGSTEYNQRKHYIYRKYNLQPTTPTIEDEYAIDTGTIMPFLGFLEEGSPPWSGFKVDHTLDRIYGFNGSFILDFAPSVLPERRVVFFDNDLTLDTFTMTLLYTASGGAATPQAPPRFNVSHAAYATYTDLPVTVPVPPYADMQGANVLVETIDEITVAVIENVASGSADFLFYPTAFKKMVYNSGTSMWELSESVANTALGGTFSPDGLVYRNRLSPISANRALMARIFRSS